MPVTKNTKQGEEKELPSAKLNLYRFKGNGVVWDRAKNKTLCRFENGELITNDIRIIAILLKKHYKYKTKHPLAREILNKSYNAYKYEIKRNEKRIEAEEKELTERKLDRKKLNNMRIPEIKALVKAKKIRITPITTKQEMINSLLGTRR